MTEIERNQKFIKELRRKIINLPDERQAAELRKKLLKKQSLLKIEENEEDYSGNLAVLLYMLVQGLFEQKKSDTPYDFQRLESEESLTSTALKLLIKLGDLGLHLAAEAIEEANLKNGELKNWLDSLSDIEAIELAGRLLSVWSKTPLKLPPVLDTISRASEIPAEKATLFLQNIAEQKKNLPFAVIDAFMTGKYGEGCAKALHLPDSMDEIITYSKSIPPYTDFELIKSLCIHLGSGDIRCNLAILEALERIVSAPADIVIKALITQLESPTPLISSKALQLLVALKKDSAANFLARIFTDRPKMRASIINRIPYLDLKFFDNFLKKIDRKSNKTIIAAVFTIISEVDPEGMTEHLEAILKTESVDDPEISDAVVILRSKIKNSKIVSPPPPKQLEGKTVSGSGFLKVGSPIVLNIDQEAERKGFRRIFGKAAKEEHDSQPDIFTDERFANQNVNKLNRWKHKALKLTFTGCTFTACDLREMDIYGCEFNFCTFKSCSFDESVFNGCRFTDCEFEACGLNSVYWFKSEMFRCTFKGCCLNNISVSGSLCSDSFFKGCSIAGAHFYDCRFIRSSFKASDLSHSMFNYGAQAGMEYEKTILKRTSFRKIRILSSYFSATNECGCIAELVDSTMPSLLKAESARLRQGFDKREEDGAPIKLPPFLNEKGYELMNLCVQNWINKRDIKRKLSRFTVNNARRTEWALEKFEPKAGDLFQLLPYLLHTDILEQFFEMDNPPVRTVVAGYHPTREVLKLSDDYFPDVTPGPIGKNPVVIETILTIGSIGTMSQTSKSDIDYWICCDLSKVDESSRQWMETRFQMLEEWAMIELEAEIHFFLMDVVDVRNNNFGMSDAESSGSAQGALLKEEFYRSAMLVAGKPPLWWIVTPEADLKTYRNYATIVEKHLGRSAIVDLGYVPRIPGEEFFGAALWQIVKGVKSPFKSIMKFGLLERYTAGDKKPLLSESIKKNILEGHLELNRVDPYMLLYHEIAEFYSKSGMPENAWLAAMSLRLKSGLLTLDAPGKMPVRREDREIMEFMTHEMNTENKNENIFTDFSSVLKLASKINLFMIQTYQRVSRTHSDSSKTMISPEDLTKLGRKISANFVERKNKISRLLLPGEKTHFFSAIHLSKSENGNWILQGEYPDPTGARNVLTEAGSQKDLHSMLAWFALNKLYDSKMKIKTDLTSAPVRKRDVSNIFKGLCSFFPHKETFDTPIEEMLNKEKIEKIYFIVNMTSAREKSEIDKIHAVYSTNWGEVFCIQLKVEAGLIENPGKYLCENMPELCPEPPTMGQFIPSQAQSPGLNIQHLKSSNKDSLRKNLD